VPLLAKSPGEIGIPAVVLGVAKPHRIPEQKIDGSQWSEGHADRPPNSLLHPPRNPDVSHCALTRIISKIPILSIVD